MENKGSNSIKSFEDLVCWQICTEIRRDISVMLKTFPKEEQYALTEDMRRASRSITHNIAEGYGRFHFRENAQFCRLSRGSLYEIMDQLITAFDGNYITEEKYKEQRNKVEKAIRILNGFIKYLLECEARKKDNTKKN